MNEPARPPRRVAILGGGIASLAAAWQLSAADDIESITVYQRGWRLGGKGASSRGEHGRIEEHGLHIWLGYYDNAFRMMRECYAELDRETTDPSCPIQTWTDAFAPAEHVGLLSNRSGAWDEWVAFFPPNDELPGEPDGHNEAMSPLSFVLRAQVLVREYLRSIDEGGSEGRITLSASPRPPKSAANLVDLGQRALDAAMAAALELTQVSIDAAADLPPTVPSVGPAVELLESLRDRLRAAVNETPARQRMFELMDLVVTNMRGILADGLLVDPRGFSAINGEEYMDWLRRHGAAAESFDSPLLRGVYDLVFGYRDGDEDLPRFAAGTALFLSSKIFFDYKGSIFWKMQAGMGDVVFAPLYEALRDRGVRFEFFHSVDDLVVAEDGRTIASVRLSKQADLAPGIDSYDPLCDFGGLRCFPAKPDVSQLETDLTDPECLETLWAQDRVETVDLLHGRDFDELVYGISLGMVPHTCRQILERDERWRNMVRHVGTAATQALQVWMHDDEKSLGWSQPGSTVTGYVKPFDTAASMSHLIDAEQWPTSDRPASIFYFCSTLKEPPPPGPESVGYHKEQDDRVRSHAVDFLERHVHQLLPGASTADGFDWNQLVDPAGRVGPERFDSQFWSANVDPSDRYVQSLPGTERFRLRPDDSGYDNLTLAGDWTDCGLNAGCIEAAVISGMQAANAVVNRDRWSAITGYWTLLVGR